MAYFRELPNIKYSSVFGSRGSINDNFLAKNIFKRGVIRNDIKSDITAFQYYQIRGNERPDQVAENFYEDPELDWVVLLTNNIINVYEEWPLDDNSLYKYMLDKYGSEKELAKTHHFETIEYRDSYQRVILEGGIVVDDSDSEVVTTNTKSNAYFVKAFPSAKTNAKISVNLNQQFTVFGRNVNSSIHIKKIETNISSIEIPSGDGTTEVSVINSLTPWPQGWGGTLTIPLRNGGQVQFTIDDVILDNKIQIPERLFEFTGSIVNGVLTPTFNFTNETPS